jgi:hypothetical protein
MQKPDDLIRVFSCMDEVCTAELEALKERSDENPIEPDDTFIDFATEDFINKNIRVRPISGNTHGDETKDGRQSNVSKGGDDAEENQQSYNLQAMMEMDDQRDVVKKKAVTYQEEQRKKLLLDEKKAQRK